MSETINISKEEFDKLIKREMEKDAMQNTAKNPDGNMPATMRYDALDTTIQSDELINPLFYIPMPAKNVLMYMPEPYTEVLKGNIDLMIKSGKDKSEMYNNVLIFAADFYSNIIRTNVNTVLYNGLFDLFRKYLTCSPEQFFAMYHMNNPFDDEVFVHNIENLLLMIVPSEPNIDSFERMCSFITNLTAYVSKSVIDWGYKLINNILVSGMVNIDGYSSYLYNTCEVDFDKGQISKYAFCVSCSLEQFTEDSKKITELAESLSAVVYKLVSEYISYIDAYTNTYVQSLLNRDHL